MSTGMWLADGATTFEKLVVWDGNASEVRDFLVAQTTLTGWPTPSVSPGSVLHFDSFEFTAPGYSDPATVPAQDFPLGCAIFVSSNDIADDSLPSIGVYTLDYAQRHGKLILDY